MDMYQRNRDRLRWREEGGLGAIINHEICRDLRPGEHHPRDHYLPECCLSPEPELPPLSMPPGRIFEIIQNHPEVRKPPGHFSIPTQPKSRFCCQYHHDYGHTTDRYRQLRTEIARLLQMGYLREFLRHKEPRRHQEDGRNERMGREEPPSEERRGNVIHVISGGPAGGDSARRRKASLRATRI